MTIYTTPAEELDLCAATPKERAGQGRWSLHAFGRHVPHSGTSGVCALDSTYGHPNARCRCEANAHRCCEHANAEDMRCEACRRWCT